MIYDLQKASILKRISAWLLDAILLVILVVGVASGVSAIVDYDGHMDELESYIVHYEQAYNIDPDMTEEKFNAMTKEEQEAYNAACDAADEALRSDADAMRTYSMLTNLSMVIITVSILVSIVLLEFVVPMLLKNGQTVGKKIFGIAVMRTGGIKVNGVCIFIRAVLGKYAVETMIPVFMVLMLLFGTIGTAGLVVILVLLLIQLFLVITTQTNSLIHDKLADTVTVDMASQMIFDTEEDLLEYKKQVAAEQAAKDPYA